MSSTATPSFAASQLRNDGEFNLLKVALSKAKPIWSPLVPPGGSIGGCTGGE